MKYFLLLFFLVSTTVFSQKKTDYNREHVIFPGCEEAKEFAKCYDTELLKFINSSLTKVISEKIIKNAKKDTIKMYSNLYYDEQGKIIKHHSKLSVSVRNLDEDFDNLLNNFPIVKPVLDNQNNGVADYVSSLFGFKVNRELSQLIPIENYQPEDVPYSVIEQVPRYKGCGTDLTNELAKKCMTAKITKHVSSNFNTRLASHLNLEPGIKKIYVIFKINKKGKVTGIKARAPHPALEEEAIRVIKLIPQLDAPGMQRGKAVNVPYSLPIVFKIEETAAQKKERKRLKRKKKFN